MTMFEPPGGRYMTSELGRVATGVKYVVLVVCFSPWGFPGEGLSVTTGCEVGMDVSVVGIVVIELVVSDGIRVCGCDVTAAKGVSAVGNVVEVVGCVV